MSASKIILVAVLMVTLALGLHLQDTTQAQIDALKTQQTNFEQSVGKLLTNISQIEKSINSTTSVDQKVIILQNAIISQRQSVFELSKIIIPPFNISKSGCEKMTDQQKVELLEQISEARKQVIELKTISSSMPKCDDVDQIKRDIQKQIFFLNSIESILYTNCSMNVILSPTIWQTNIYAPNWVLGNMTIDDLIQQYYQRSIRYDNITNCHVETPFFDGKECILCPTATPIFDISQKKCLACPAETKIDNAQKKCLPIKRYTNFDTLVNFFPSTGPFPTPDPDAVPCPKQTPYFNGVSCIACNLPQYFDIASQTCKNCPTGTIYGLNQRQCTKVRQNMLTKLQNTRWVTGPNNFTTVIQQRQSLLESDTTGKYQECPDATPYYDSIDCIDCAGQEFDLTTKKCGTAPKGTQYDPNLHNYIPPMTNGQTLATSPNLIGKPPANDPAVPDCTQDKPYWDGISCISCPDPFVYFDLSTKTCVVCDPKDYYDAATKSCLPRKTIYISTNEDKLLATPAQSVADYKNKVAKTIDSNPNAIIVNCDSATQYSNFDSCFNCAATEYFNVETLKCDTCVGKYDATTKLCVKNVTPAAIFTNLSSPYIVNIADSAKEQQKINDELTKNPDSKVCDITTPFSDGKSCFPCNPPTMYFDYSKKACIGCLDNQFLDSDGNCVDSPLVSNVEAIKTANKYIETQPDSTISAINKTIQGLKDSGTPYLQCSQGQPYYNPTTKSCSSLCPAGQYLDLASTKCIPCASYDPATHSCPAPPQQTVNYADLNKNNWIAKDPAAVSKQQQDLSKQPNAVVCPSATPFLNKGNCVACSPPTPLFNYDTQKCEACATTFNPVTHSCPPAPPAVNYPDLSNNNWIAKDPAAVSKQRDDLIKQGGVICPSATPFVINSNCAPCSAPTPLFNFDTQKCEACPTTSTFDPATHSCAPTILQYPNVKDNNWISSDLKSLSTWVTNLKNKGATQCSLATPHYNGVNCLACSAPTPIFNYDTKKCESCPTPKVLDINVHQCLIKLDANTYQTNLNSPNLIYGGIPLAQYQQQYNDRRDKYNTKDCVQPNFYWDGINCIECPSGLYFNMENNLCMRCPPGNTYDGTTNPSWKGCVNDATKNKVVITPDIAKMYANIF